MTGMAWLATQGPAAVSNTPAKYSRNSADLDGRLPAQNRTFNATNQVSPKQTFFESLSFG
jgi:hypothetical protein